jgi:hypothetical protein
MYIATIPNRNSPPAILLRESFRENGKVKNRTIANLSHWPPARIEALRRLLGGEFDQALDLSPGAQLGRVFGLLCVLKQIAAALGLGAALRHSRLAKLALFLVLARVAHRGSRLSAVRWAEDQAVAEVLDLGAFDEDDLYAALDNLAARQEKRGMVKSKGKEALTAAGLRYITVLTDPQIRGLLGQGILQLSLFSEQVCEGQGQGVRYILPKNPAEGEREQHRLEDKLAKLEAKIAVRNQHVREHPRCQPEAGRQALEAWAGRHKLTSLVAIRFEGTPLQLQRNEEAIRRALELAGCYVVTTDVVPAALGAQQVHDSYVSLQKVERDFRTLKTGLLEVRPVWVRKESRTRGHEFCCLLALKVSRELERRLRAAFGTTETRADAITLLDALLALTRLCLLHYAVDEKTTVTQLPQPDARQQGILNALGVSLPSM